MPLSGNYLETRNSGATIMEILDTGTVVLLSGNYIVTRNSNASIMELYRY